MTTLKAKVILNIKTAAEWAASTDVLLEGELGIESDTRLIKIGNGTDTYANLPYTAASDINDIEGVTVTNPTDGNVLTYSNGEWVNITPSSLPADTDLSHYDNTTSGFITASDIPALPEDRDLSHYDNTNSDFATVSDIPTNVSELNNDAGYITSATIPSVGDGTITIQQNSVNVDSFTTNQDTNKTINITVPTKTSELTNDSGFITASSQATVNDATLTIQQNGSEVGTFTANAFVDSTVDIITPTNVSQLNNDAGYVTSSSIPTVGSGTLTIQQDGVDVGSFSANASNDVTIDLAGGGGALYEKDVTNGTTSDYFMIDPNGVWDTTSYLGQSYVNIVPQRSFVDNDTLYINSPAGGIYTSNIVSDTPTLSGRIPAWNGPHYIIIHNTTTGYYALYFSYNEYVIRYFPFNGTPTNIDNGFCVGTHTNSNYKIYSQDVDSIVKNGYLYVIFSGGWRFSSTSSFSCGGFVRSVKIDLLNNSCTPYTITYNNTSYSPSSIPSATDCSGYSRVFFIGDPESTDHSPVACVDLQMRSNSSGATSAHARGYWDSEGTFTTTSLPKFLGGISGFTALDDLSLCPSNSANIAFVATYIVQSTSSSYPHVHISAYAQDLTEIWDYDITVNLYSIYHNYAQRMASIAVDNDIYFVYYYYTSSAYYIVLEKRDLATGAILNQTPLLIDRPQKYSFMYKTNSWNSLYGSIYTYIKDINIEEYNDYLLISTVSVDNSSETTSGDVKYYWTVNKVKKDPNTVPALIADNSLVASDPNVTIGTQSFPWKAGYFLDLLTVGGVHLATSEAIGSLIANCFFGVTGNWVRFTGGVPNNTAGGLAPAADNKLMLGQSSYRWSSVYAATGTIQTSDRDKKDNIIPLEDALTKLNRIPIYSYTWKENATSIVYGLVAQEVLETSPELIDVPEDYKEGDGTLGVYSSNVLFLAVKAIQELSSKVDELNAKIKVLEGKV